jgi:hypothetical protein
MWSDLWTNTLDWCEKHAGLGGWIGAVGSILAILAAWYLARAEYRRAMRREAAKLRSERATIGFVIQGFDSIVQKYIENVRTGDTALVANYDIKHMNDPEYHAARDLAFIPVTHWPSLATYFSFKSYWFLAMQVLQTSQHLPIVRENLDQLTDRCAMERDCLILILEKDI